MPPRPKPASLCASILACVAWPLGMACGESPWPPTQVIPSRVQRVADPYQVSIHATAMARSYHLGRHDLEPSLRAGCEMAVDRARSQPGP
jgi:hypothetical protein